MSRVVRVVILVGCGVIGAWVGYWLGHLAGWSENADWPGRIGGGVGAVLLSIGLSVLSVLIAGTIVFLLPQRRARRVLAGGSPARATVLSVEDTGGRIRGRAGKRRQVSCELEVFLSDSRSYRARATQFVSPGLEATLRPGVAVAVRYDPAHRDRVAVEGPVERAA